MVSQYEAPDRWATAENRLGWFREAYQEGDAWLRQQRAIAMMKPAMDLIAGKEIEEIPAKLSKAFHNRLKRQVREAVAIQSQINPSWYYEASNKQFDPVAQQVNQLHKAWWGTSFADLDVRKAVQYKEVLGTSYMSPRWAKPRGVWGEGDIKLDVYGPGDVRFLFPSRDYDIQSSYGVIVTVEMPLSQARQMYPEFADRIVADREQFAGGDSRARRVMERAVQGFGSLAFRKFGATKVKQDVGNFFPTVDVHYLYLNDNSVNSSQSTIPMGKPGTTWHYEVPYYGQEIPSSLVDLVTGKQTTRRAGWDDCRMYPMRRMAIFTKTALLYDDTSIYWHGRVPLVRFRSDDWPWEALGYGMMLDGAPLQREMNNVLRGIGDTVGRAMRPGLAYDTNSVSQGDMSKYDPREPGVRIRLNLQSSSDPIRSILPESLLKVESSWIEYLRVIAEFMDHQSAVTDFRNLAKAKQIPSDATIDKILEISGPLVQDATRTMEKSMAELGQMVLPMMFQFYTTKRKLSVVSQDKISVEYFDFDPQDLIPNEMQPGISRISPVQKWQVMREFQHTFRMVVLPNSLHEATQTQQKLLMLQLWRDGRFPLDPATLANTLGIRNFGDPWPDTTSIYERYKKYMADMVPFQGVLQALAQIRSAQVMMQAGMGMGMGGGGMEQPGGEGGPKAFADSANGDREQRGRPPSGKKMPQIQTKDGGGRTTVTES